jgi:hypothetical protein
MTSGTANETPGSPGDAILTADQVLPITHRLCRDAGLDSRGAYLIKFTINAVVAIPAAAAVLRIAGSAPTRARIPGVIAAAHWFSEQGVPAVRLWPDIEQPLTAGEHQATLWRMADAGGPKPAPSDLARILKSIHSLGTPPGIPAWAPLDGMRQRLAHAGHVDDSTRDQLTTRLNALAKDLGDLDQAPLIPPGIIHGDAHLGNLIPTSDGPIVCDFDSTSIGPREWDLTPAAVGALRFDYGPVVHHELSAAYGVDVTTWSGFPILRRLRELQLVISVIPLLDANPRLRPQWEHRVFTLAHPDPTRPWTPFANL